MTDSPNDRTHRDNRTEGEEEGFPAGDVGAPQASPDRATAVEPVPVSPLRDGIAGAAVPGWARDPRNGGSYSTCADCGAFYELVRPGKSQPTCDCHRLCPEHGCLDEYRVAPRGHTGGGVFGYVCPQCWPPCDCAGCVADAAAIEARRGETGTGSVGDESAIPKGAAQFIPPFIDDETPDYPSDSLTDGLSTIKGGALFHEPISTAGRPHDHGDE